MRVCEEDASVHVVVFHEARGEDVNVRVVVLDWALVVYHRLGGWRNHSFSMHPDLSQHSRKVVVLILA